MTWRIAALITLAGIAAMPASSWGAAPTGRAATLNVTVKPPSGSVNTHFVVSFRAAVSTGPLLHNTYRVAAGGPGHGGCQAEAAAEGPATKAGSIVRVVLSPSRSARWCAGTYRGQVWDVITEGCRTERACPVIMPAPQLVGRFTFRVARG